MSLLISLHEPSSTFNAAQQKLYDDYVYTHSPVVVVLTLNTYILQDFHHRK